MGVQESICLKREMAVINMKKEEKGTKIYGTKS